MSMLAERRFRKKYTLTPRGKPLYEDESRFGTKILQKMGWSKEKGLGANEDGSKDFVRVHFKNNACGLGYEDRDDQWTKHEESFNGLLNALNNESDSSSKKCKESASEDEAYVGFGFSNGVTSKQAEKSALKDNLSGLSLEERSKKSKARVHYKKFTKNKDLSQYSEKDLANIFGKKANDQDTSNGDIFQQIAAAQNNEQEPENTVENPFMINTNVSLNDYFKQKMEARKMAQKVEPKLENSEDNTNHNEKKVKTTKDTLEEEDQDQLDENNETTVSTKKKNKKKKIKDEVMTPVANNELDEVAPKKKSKRRILEENQNMVGNEILDKPIEVQSQNEEQIAIKKKKKSKKHKSVESETDLMHEETKVINDELDRNVDEVASKKKSKRQFVEENQNMNSNEILDKPSACHKQNEEHTIIKKKKKSKKHKSGEDEIDLRREETEVCEEVQLKKKQKSNIKEIESSTHLEEATNTTEKKKKLKKKNTETESEAVIVENGVSNTEHTNNKIENSNSEEECVEQQEISLEELKNKLNSYNTVNISTFVAEKFRNIEFEKFNGATLGNLNGYSYEDTIELNVEHVPFDDERINRLWNLSFNKYSNPKSSFYEYKKRINKTEVRTNKIMRFDVKKFNRKNIFQGSLV